MSFSKSVLKLWAVSVLFVALASAGVTTTTTTTQLEPTPRPVIPKQNLNTRGIEEALNFVWSNLVPSQVQNPATALFAGHHNPHIPSEVASSIQNLATSLYGVLTSKFPNVPHATTVTQLVQPSTTPSASSSVVTTAQSSDTTSPSPTSRAAEQLPASTLSFPTTTESSMSYSSTLSTSFTVTLQNLSTTATPSQTATTKAGSGSIQSSHGSACISLLAAMIVAFLLL